MYHKGQSYDVWFLRFGVQWTDIFVILHCFLPFYSPNNPENLNFEKMKKIPGDIIILKMCIINDNHMNSGSWDMEHNKHNSFSFLIGFCTFTPLTTAKSKFWKNEKNLGDIIILHNGTKNHDHMLHCSSDTTCGGCNFCISFWAIFFSFIPLTTQKNHFF